MFWHLKQDKRLLEASHLVLIAVLCPPQNASNPETLGFEFKGTDGKESLERLYPNSSIRFWQSVVFSMIISTETNSLYHLQVSSVHKVVMPFFPMFQYPQTWALWVSGFLHSIIRSKANVEWGPTVCQILTIEFLKIIFFLCAWYPYVGIKMFQSSL